MEIQSYIIGINVNPKWPPKQNGGLHVSESSQFGYRMKGLKVIFF